MTASGKVVYLAAPMVTYHTERYERNRERVAALFPGAELICPPDGPLYPDGHTFSATFRGHVAACTDLVCFPDEDGFLGRGTVTEVSYAQRLGKAVWHLTDDGELVLDPVVVVVDPGDPYEHAVIVTE